MQSSYHRNVRICSLLFAFLFYLGLSPQVQVEPWFAQLPQITKYAELTFDGAIEQGPSYRHLQKQTSKGLPTYALPEFYFWQAHRLVSYNSLEETSSLQTLRDIQLPRSRAPPESPI